MTRWRLKLIANREGIALQWWKQPIFRGGIILWFRPRVRLQIRTDRRLRSVTFR